MSEPAPRTTDAPWVRVCFRLESQAEERVLAWIQDEEGLGSETRPAGAGATDFRIYFAARQEAVLSAAIDRLQASLGLPVVSTLELVRDDRWVEEYQRGLEPFDVGERFRVFPGESQPPAGMEGAPRVALPLDSQFRKSLKLQLHP